MSCCASKVDNNNPNLIKCFICKDVQKRSECCRYFQKRLWLHSPWSGRAFVCLIHIITSPTKILLLFRCSTHIFNYLNTCILFSQTDLFLLSIAAWTSWKLALIKSVENREFISMLWKWDLHLDTLGRGEVTARPLPSIGVLQLGLFWVSFVVEDWSLNSHEPGFIYVSSPRRRPAFEHGSWLQSRAVSQDDLEFRIILQQLQTQMLLTLRGLSSSSQHPSQTLSSHWLPVLETLQKHYSVLF